MVFPQILNVLTPGSQNLCGIVFIVITSDPETLIELVLVLCYITF
jgi:hypothetical protein